ncbi:hypothetical protein Q7473_00835 [Glaesserella parasuis]|nr:hypothetical protein [Glaesserella parasuis]
MKDREKFFYEIRKDLFNRKDLSELSQLVSLIEGHLKNLTLKDIQDTQKWIDETIDMYYQYELDKAIEKANEEIEYIEDEDGYYKEHNKYIKQVWHDRYEPDIDLIIEDFNVETRWIENDGYTLEWLLETKFRDVGLIDGIESYQIMAIMALEFIERFINGDSYFIDNSYKNQNSFRAFLAFISAEKFKNNLDIVQIKIQSKKEISIKASKARHKDSNRMKEIVISKWKKYFELKKQKGQQASKNDFAKKIYEELKDAYKKDPENNKQYSLKTIRNNWLQGI